MKKKSTNIQAEHGVGFFSDLHNLTGALKAHDERWLGWAVQSSLPCDQILEVEATVKQKNSKLSVSFFFFFKKKYQLALKYLK